MKKHSRILLLVITLAMLMAMVSCTAQKEPDAEEPDDKAELVFKNGVIQTMVSEDDVAQAVAISNGTIVYVG